MSLQKQDLSDPDLEFSHKYNPSHALEYFHKHQQGFWRRLSNWREQQIAAKALRIAGDPESVLDLPCGTGRFWELLANDERRKLYAADNSRDMLNVGMQFRPAEVVRRFEIFQANAFDVEKEDNFVDCVFSIRFMHHLGDWHDRLLFLKEVHRLARQSVIVSLWVDGNLKAIRRKAAEARRYKRYQNRFVLPVEVVESEFTEAGFEIIDKVDFLKRYSMWRFYILRPVGK